MHGLIATAHTDDPAVRRALDRAVDYLLRRSRGGQWTNGTPLYTLHLGVEYYDAPEMTTAIVLMALERYRDYRGEKSGRLRERDSR